MNKTITVKEAFRIAYDYFHYDHSLRKPTDKEYEAFNIIGELGHMPVDLSALDELLKGEQ